MHTIIRCGFLAAALLAPTLASAGELRLSIANGRVTLVANDVPIRQILDEWARIGQTKVVNADKIVGPPVTMTLTDVPEARALESLLRSASGYILAPRRAGATGASIYELVSIMPLSRGTVASASAPVPVPAFTRQPQAVVQPDMLIDDDIESPIPPNGVIPPGMQGPYPMQGQGPYPMQGNVAQPVQQQLLNGPGVPPPPVIPPTPGVYPPQNAVPQPYQSQPGVQQGTVPQPGTIPYPQPANPGVAPSPIIGPQAQPGRPGGRGGGGQNQDDDRR